MSYSPHGKRALAAITDLKRVYEMDYDVHDLKGEILQTEADEP